jgi:hypothetical protein
MLKPGLKLRKAIDMAVIHHDVCRDFERADLLDLLDWEHAEAMKA